MVPEEAEDSRERDEAMSLWKEYGKRVRWSDCGSPEMLVRSLSYSYICEFTESNCHKIQQILYWSASIFGFFLLVVVAFQWPQGFQGDWAPTAKGSLAGQWPLQVSIVLRSFFLQDLAEES